MNDQAKPISRRWRRFLRFSLRGMIVIVLVIGVSLGWLVRCARIQREAVAAIEKSGGWVMYDCELKDGSRFGERESWGPTWLVNMIGVDYFGNVVVVDMWRASELNLSYTQVSDAGLVHLRGLTNLSELNLGFTQVSDAGLVHLARLTKLSSLNLFRSHVTEAGVKALREALPNLRISGN